MQPPKKCFVPRLEFPKHEVPIASFAAHHRRALADLRFLSGQVDLVLELRDSRAPLSSVNPLINKALPGIPKLTIYTKRDESPLKASHVEPLHSDQNFRLISMEKKKYASRLLKDFRTMAEAQSPKPPLGFKVLVAGMPNAGKSTLINKFRVIFAGKYAPKVARTGSTPGITRAVSEQILVSETPRVYVLDTPGVLMPQIHNWEQMLKLCLIGAVPRGLVDPMVLADYLLYHINRWYPNGGRYPGELSNDIETVLWNLAHTKRRLPSRDTWDPNHTADEWVDRFIRGGIGKVNLDDLSIDVVEKELEKQQSLAFDLNALLPPSVGNMAKRKQRRL